MEKEILESFQSSTVIFQGEAIDVAGKTKPSDLTDPSVNPSLQRERVKWRVQHAWKGGYAPGTIIETVTNTACCVCGLSVTQGTVYVVHLDGPLPQSISSCSATKPALEAGRDIEILNRIANGGGT